MDNSVTVIVILIVVLLATSYLSGAGQEPLFPSTIYVCSENQKCPPGTHEASFKPCSKGQASQVDKQKSSEEEGCEPTAEEEAAAKCKIERGVNYYGNTFLTKKAKDPNFCCLMCIDNPKCRSWSFDQNKLVCRLKYEQGANRTGCPNVTSGYPRESEAAKADDSGVVKYGDQVQLEALATRWRGHAGFLSPCGYPKRGDKCGVGVTLRPDKAFTQHEPNSNLRNWLILGQSTGTPVKYGDLVELKATASRWAGHDGNLSPCGHHGACGVDVTLRIDSEFNRWEPNSNLRKWRVEGGDNGVKVKAGDTVQLKATASRWKGHDGYLSPCGGKGECGVNVTLRPDSEFNKWEPDSKLRQWRIHRIGGPTDAQPQDKKHIKVVQATYGANCPKVKKGNVTRHIATACDGKPTCTYKIDHKKISDPAYGCRKTYDVEYQCGNDTKTSRAPPEASGRTVTLRC